MCDRNSVLVIFLILKVLILLILPIILFVLYKRNSKMFNIVAFANIIFLVLFIVLRLTNNGCVNNSTFSYIKNNIGKINKVDENKDMYYETVYSTEQYTNGDSSKAYAYSINYNPLKNVLISCNKKSYMEHYGAGVSAITTLIANYYDIDINIVDVLTVLENKKLIDCTNGIDFDKAFNAIGEKYNYKVKTISASQLDYYVSNGRSVLVETTNKPEEDNNFGCEKGYIVVYNKTNEGYFNIINPNDQYESYFCSSNTIGYSSIIEGNQNEKAYTFDNINSKALRYFVIEVE